MVTLDDVTILEENRVELKEARDAADAASQAKSDFLANMSHEIRTPMNAILGFTDVLRRGMEENPEQRFEYLNTIHTSGNHLIELINDILDLSKVEAGKLELELRETALPQLLAETTHVLSARAKQQDLQLSYEVIDEIPTIIQSDATRIKQVLINLVGNAIKFTEHGAVQLRCHYTDGVVQFDIVDSGIGMTPEQMSRIFDPFSQADSSVTRRFGGTGLGLAICKKFVEALGGTITVQSEIGQGTTFSASIPALSDSKSRLLDHQACVTLIREGQSKFAGTSDSQLNPAQILVVDDGKTNRSLVSIVAKRHGLQVLEAENGKVAIEQVVNESIDLILMDMQMPVMDGYTAARELRKMGVKTPIVALTGNAMQGDKQKCLDAGCDSFLAKPIEIDQLIALFGEHLGFLQAETIDIQPTEPPQPVISPSPLPPTESQPEQRQLSEPWTTTLPIEDPEFRRIAEKFVEGLPEKLQSMIDALHSGNLQELRELGHWLKGAGGTVGFGRFTEPSIQLETAAAEGDLASSNQTLQTIVSLAAAIDLDLEPSESL